MKTYRVVFVEETAHNVEVKAKDKAEAIKIADSIYYGHEEELSDKEFKQYQRTRSEPQANEYISCEVQE